MKRPFKREEWLCGPEIGGDSPTIMVVSHCLAVPLLRPTSNSAATTSSGE